MGYAGYERYSEGIAHGKRQVRSLLALLAQKYKYVSIRQHTSAYVSIRQSYHTSAYVSSSVRSHTATV